MTTGSGSTPSYPAALAGHSVASFFVQMLADHAASQGLDIAQLFQRAGLDVAVLEDPEQRIPLADFLTLCTVAERELKDDCLGIQVGMHMKPDYLGPYGFALMSCNTGREVIAQAQRYSVLAIGGGQNVFEEVGDECIRYWRHELGDAVPGLAIVEEMVMASSVAAGRIITGQAEFSPRWASFRRSAPGSRSLFDAHFRCELRFNAQDNAIALDGGMLDTAFRHSHPVVRDQLSALCDQLLAQLTTESDPDWLQACRRHIVASLHVAPPELSVVAGELGMAPSTLRKRLSEQGTSFRALLDEIRQKMAMNYLDDPQMSLLDVAYLLGFSEQSAFQRAFKRWTGKTPGEFKRG